MSPSTHVLGGAEATFAIARVTLKRTVRGNALWVVLGLCVLPELFALPVVHGIVDWPAVYRISALLRSLLAPILLASAIGEEIEEKTMSYLWSRPLPRWSILLGKMVALVPILALALCASLVLPFFTALGGEGAGHTDVLGRTLIAVIAGAIAASAVTAGFATLAPRFGTVLGIAYLVLVDAIVGALGSGLSRITVAHNAYELAGFDGSMDLAALVWLGGLTALWLGIAALRIRRIE